jgi:sigma-B regulation protein RsbU (phosphoserine phosphatase)
LHPGVSIHQAFDRRIDERAGCGEQHEGMATMYQSRDTYMHSPEWATVEIPQTLTAGCGEEVSLAAHLPESPWSDARGRAIHELEDVRRVSARLFPRTLPQLATLACSGLCLEARHASGDFYDFFELGAHRLGFVVGDISGKGMASALVRATLQASLRTLWSAGVQDLQQSLALVNHLLFESTPEAMYATLFFAEYDEMSRRLRYVNCGHPAPLLYGGGRIKRLQTTSQVLGLFSDWRCCVGEVELTAGDTLLVYTDGVTEAADEAGEEFGEARLVTILEKETTPLRELLQQCVREVCRFAPTDQRDDMTLVALRGIGS